MCSQQVVLPCTPPPGVFGWRERSSTGPQHILLWQAATGRGRLKHGTVGHTYANAQHNTDTHYKKLERHNSLLKMEPITFLLQRDLEAATYYNSSFNGNGDFQVCRFYPASVLFLFCVSVTQQPSHNVC